MSYEIHANYEQTFLLPPSLDDWVAQDHPARFVREFVDSLDLSALGFNFRESIDGRPNYSAELLSKIVIYGSLERIRSTRKLEKMCYNDVGTIWLTGMERPDHNTIDRFLRHNKCAIGNLFSESVRLAAGMGLIGLVLQAVDGTKIAADVVQDENDRHLLTEMIAQAEENFGETPQESVADAGYCSGEELARAEEAGYEVLVNLPNNSSTKFGHIAEQFDKSNFTYDPETDTYTCPKGGTLVFQAYCQKPKQRYVSKRYRCKDYKGCPFRRQCSKDRRGRAVSRPFYEDKIIKQREKQAIPQNQQKLLRRKTIVEPSFGIIKRIMGFRRFTVRGLQNVQAQWSLVCMAFNLRKVHRYWVFANQIP